MRHLDLFSGIGGAALAVDVVWPNSEHIFCEIDPYCQALLKLRFPNSQIHGDIRTLTTNSDGRGHVHGKSQKQSAEGRHQALSESQSGIESPFILTGGFPCQPFSQAGRRKGKDDDRFLWPEMLRVIKEFKPTWIIGENVAGILTMAQQQSEIDVAGKDVDEDNNYDRNEAGGILWDIINDLEQADYSVQAFVIPAVALNAPHRRDRVWIVANRNGSRPNSESAEIRETKEVSGINREALRRGGTSGVRSDEHGDASDAGRIGQEKQQEQTVRGEQYSIPFRDSKSAGQPSGDNGSREGKYGRTSERSLSWDRDWIEVATELCGVDDGLPAELDGLKLSKSRHKTERLKGLGNAWVPQVAIEIMKGIKAIS